MMFVVMTLQKFELEPKGGYLPPLPITVETKMRGFLPVYDKEEDANADFPGSEILEIRFKGGE